MGAAVADAPGKEPASHDAVCIFSLGPERFALDLSVVDEVVETGEVTPLPSAPDFMLGLANVRGEIVPVIDITSFVGGERLVPALENPLLVLHIEDGRVGLMVHRVVGIRDVARTDWQPTDRSYVSAELVEAAGRVAWIDIALVLRDGRRAFAQS